MISRTSVNNRCNLQSSDRMTILECKIDSLLESNDEILKIANFLETNINQVLNAADTRNGRSPPENQFEFMDSLEIMNKLEEIYRCVNHSQVGDEAQQSNQNHVIENFLSAIERENKYLRQTMTPCALYKVNVFVYLESFESRIALWAYAYILNTMSLHTETDYFSRSCKTATKH